jgi:hypothetical protein
VLQALRDAGIELQPQRTSTRVCAFSGPNLRFTSPGVALRIKLQIRLFGAALGGRLGDRPCGSLRMD